jgi:class 3 adenylate cyclase
MAFCTSCGAAVPAGARFCPNCGATISDEGPREERKLATVLFADLVGSTALADSQDAERTRAVLNRFYDAMSEEIADAGGTVEKFIGDAVMAAFGAPAAQEDHADRALHAALSMRRTLAALFGDALHLRIGVNTGDVVVGAPRVGSSFVTGDVVNVAARLEQAAKPGEILVGGRTVAATRTAFDFGPEEIVEAKGKVGGCRVPCASRGRHGNGASGPAGFRRARGRARQPPRGFRARHCGRRETGCSRHPGRAGNRKERACHRVPRLALQPVAIAGTTRGTLPVLRPGERVRASRRDRPRACRGARAPPHTRVDQPAPEGVHPLAVREHLRTAWLELLAQLTSSGPAVVIVEDLHWADPELIELLDDGARRASGPLLLLGTARDSVGWPLRRSSSRRCMPSRPSC